MAYSKVPLRAKFHLNSAMVRTVLVPRLNFLECLSDKIAPIAPKRLLHGQFLMSAIATLAM